MNTFYKTLVDLTEAQPFHAGWHFKDVVNDKVAGYRDNEIFSSGSVRKIFILMGTLKLVHDGVLSLDQKITIEEKYQKNRSGIFQHFTPGFVISLRDALIMMITVSDNTCTGMLVDLASLSMLNSYCEALGFKKTKLKSPFPPLGKEAFPEYTDTTSPEETSRLLSMVLEGSSNEEAAQKLGCSSVLCQLALNILSWQKFNTKLPLLLPADAKVAHKTGTREGVVNDVGIIYRKDQPLFILSVFTNNVPAILPDGTSSKFKAQYFIGQLARLCWDRLEE